MSLTVTELRTYIRSEFNILLVGKHGTGKTTMLMDACKEENLKLKIFNAASMDAYTDLVGVPKFVTREDGTEELKNVRPREIDEAEVIFIDELNRAFDPKTTNAVFELIQFRSINGEKLPKLKCVIAAQNPVTDDAYDVSPLDPALEDRFHLVIDIEPNVNLLYLSTKLDKNIAKALVEWYNGHNSKTNYISPRRIEMLGQVYSKTKSRKALESAMPTTGKFDVGKLYTMLKESSLSDIERAKEEKKRKEQIARLTKIKENKRKNGANVIRIIRNNGINKKNTLIRKEGGEAVKNALLDKTLSQQERNLILSAVHHEIGVNRLIDEWDVIFSVLSDSEIKEIRNKFGYIKNNNIRREIRKRISAGDRNIEPAFIKAMDR